MLMSKISILAYACVCVKVECGFFLWKIHWVSFFVWLLWDFIRLVGVFNFTFLIELRQKTRRDLTNCACDSRSRVCVGGTIIPKYKFYSTQLLRGIFDFPYSFGFDHTRRKCCRILFTNDSINVEKSAICNL